MYNEADERRKKENEQEKKEFPNKRQESVNELDALTNTILFTTRSQKFCKILFTQVRREKEKERE